jgi:hypothetical protein
MRKGRSTAARTPKKPAYAVAGAVLLRKFAIKLFDREEGEAANWPMIADKLFRAVFGERTGHGGARKPAHHGALCPHRGMKLRSMMSSGLRFEPGCR